MGTPKYNSEAPFLYLFCLHFVCLLPWLVFHFLFCLCHLHTVAHCNYTRYNLNISHISRPLWVWNGKPTNAVVISVCEQQWKIFRRASVKNKHNLWYYYSNPLRSSPLVNPTMVPVVILLKEPFSEVFIRHCPKWLHRIIFYLSPCHNTFFPSEQL